MRVRAAAHAGTWYKSEASALQNELSAWLGAANNSVDSVRAIIAPHAGYLFSGPTAAYAYASIDPIQTNRIFILGPSHHIYINGCALSQCDAYETPLGNLPIDREVVAQLNETGQFETLSIQADEEEHSIEMQLPYISHIMSNNQGQFKIVPILVGATDFDQERMYGDMLAPYLADPTNFFVISSDFCHWGTRFRYTYQLDPSLPIHESIAKLDRLGMDAIESKDPQSFSDYLNRTNNTICGRHPIGVLMHALDAVAKGRVDGPSVSNITIQFVKYAQSGKVKSAKQSSVSYAAGIVTIA